MIRSLPVLAILAGLVGCADSDPGNSAHEAAIASEIATAGPSVTNIADAFIAFYDATEGQATEDRVAAFKRDVASAFPDFYDVDHFGGGTTRAALDERIANAIAQFPRIRDAYMAKVEQFDRELDRNLQSFLRTFPDFEFDAPVVFLHSLGELDGGTRAFDGETYLMFGADVMAWVHDWDDESAFFHHELFHVHHSAFFDECDAMWCALWAEGLAVHVASTLNPDAGDSELLLQSPNGMAEATNAHLAESLAHLETALFRTGEDDYSALFNAADDGTGLPPRRGYYLGFLVAQEVGADRDLAALARLSNDDVLPLVEKAVADLLARAPKN